MHGCFGLLWLDWRGCSNDEGAIFIDSKLLEEVLAARETVLLEESERVGLADWGDDSIVLGDADSGSLLKVRFFVNLRAIWPWALYKGHLAVVFLVVTIHLHFV